jgi:hypothetical protein
MTVYTAIADSEIDPESPYTTTLATKNRDNPIAITEGASGAPKIDPINAMAHGGATGAIGTYAFCVQVAGTATATGATVAGSSLRYTNVNNVAGSGTPSGTWRLMGYITAISSLNGISSWLRVS